MSPRCFSCSWPLSGGEAAEDNVLSCKFYITFPSVNDAFCTTLNMKAASSCSHSANITTAAEDFKYLKHKSSGFDSVEILIIHQIVLIKFLGSN